VLVQRILYGTTADRHRGWSGSLNVKAKTIRIFIALAWLIAGASTATDKVIQFIPAAATLKIGRVSAVVP
jgi:hypothetical protein